MLKPLRQELAAVLEKQPAARRPAVRRADSGEWLLCTDLPQLIPEPGLADCVAELENSGWRTACREGWLYLDHELSLPETEVKAEPEGECGCAAVLLARHPDDLWEPETARQLAKAAEQGRPALERLCRQLHREWAARLRLHQPLPGKLAPWLKAAWAETEHK